MATVIDQLPEVQRLYSDGLYQQAYAAALAIGPLETWTEPAARVLAGRLSNCLGGSRFGQMTHLRAYREAPTNPLVRYFGLRRASWGGTARGGRGGRGGASARWKAVPPRSTPIGSRCMG